MESTKAIIEDFLAYKKITCPSNETIEFYRGYLRRFFKFTKINIADLSDRTKFRIAYAKIYDRPISIETKIKYLKIIRHFSDFLVDEKIIPENIASKHPTPKKKHKTIRETFDRQEIVSIFHFLDDYYYEHWYFDKIGIYDRNRLIVFMFLFTGIRRSELVHLRLHHIHKDYLFIEGGKGDKDRVVMIPRWLSDMITGYIAKYKLTDYLFTGRRRESIKPSAINRIFQNISRNTGIDIYAHKFRHTYATTCIDNNIPLNVLQSQLGHSSINTTAIYIHTNQEVAKREISKLQNSYYFC